MLENPKLISKLHYLDDVLVIARHGNRRLRREGRNCSDRIKTRSATRHADFRVATVRMHVDRRKNVKKIPQLLYTHLELR